MGPWPWPKEIVCRPLLPDPVKMIEKVKVIVRNSSITKYLKDTILEKN